MAFAARSSLASGLSRHLNRRLHPSLPHLVPSHHDRRGDPSCSSPSPPPPPTHQPSRFPSGDLTLPLPFGAHRNFSSGAEVDTAAGGLLSNAASSVVPALSFPGEVAAAAADSLFPFAAVQHLIDAVHSFTGLNWWASIALATVLVRTATLPRIVHQLKSDRKFNALKPEVKAIDKAMLNALKPEVKAIDKAMLNSTDPQAKQERDKKLSELLTKHGVSRLTPYKLLFIQGPIFLSFSCAIQNMIEKVPSLKGGGAYWFTDLTTPDELYILPVLTSMAFAADELRIKAELARSPRLQQIKNWNRALAVLILPLSMSFCKAHFFYWVPWTLFSLAYRFAFRQPVVRQYLDLPPLAPRPVPATRVPASEEPKPIRAVDSPPAVSVSAQSSSEPRDKSVHVEKRRTPSVITIRVRE